MLREDVTREVVLNGAPGARRVTLVHLGWSRDDPLAVALRLGARPPHPSTPRGSWAVLRDFLRYGLEVPTGDGDVRIRPLGTEVRLELWQGGHAHAVSLPCTVVREFLDETEALVPAGGEGGEEAVDALIARLLEY